MIKRMSNADFHKFLTKFSDAVAQGKYKKMPYDKYRTFRNWRNTSVDVVLDSYTNLNGNIVTRIRISPEGPTGYEFYIDDGSFGNFCYDYLKKEEPKVHPENENKKIQYDIFGNVMDGYSCCSYDQASAAKAISELADKYKFEDTSTGKSIITNTVKGDSYSLSSLGSASTATIHADISTCHTGIKTGLEVVQESLETVKDDVDAIGERTFMNENNLAKFKNEVEAVLAHKADCAVVDEIVDELRAEVYDIKHYANDLYYSSIDGLEYTMKEMKDDYSALEEDYASLEARICELEMKQKSLLESEYNTQGVSSNNCYPLKNFKINVAAWDTPCSDDRKEKENMDTNKMFNFDFGPVASHIRMSPYGLAMKNADGKYVSYDKATGNIMDVEIFNFDAQKFLYKMPVPVNQVAVGDIVVHMRKPMFVRAVKDGVVSVIDIYNAEAKDILPVKSPFGFNFITKVVSLIDMTGATAETPFGNMLPLLMLGEGQDFKNVLPLMLMNTNNSAFGNVAQNPLMLYALMGDNSNLKDMLPFMLMGNMFQAPAAVPAQASNNN